jgi:glycopeptide antibiotics resistance protein
MAKRLAAAVILVAYSAVLVRVLVFKNVLIDLGPLRFRFVQETGPANFLPFRTISSYLFGEQARLVAIINLIGNVALFAPIGFLLPFVFPRMTWSGSVALGIVAGLAVEGMEAAFHTGVFDVDDLILNALGVVAGYGAFILAFGRARRRRVAG